MPERQNNNLNEFNEDNEDSTKIISSEPMEYYFKIQGKFKAGDISDFLSNDLPLEDNLFAHRDKDLLSSQNNKKDYKPQK